MTNTETEELVDLYEQRDELEKRIKRMLDGPSDDIVQRNGAGGLAAWSPELEAFDRSIEKRNHVRVGVRAWDASSPAKRDTAWGASFQCAWVEIDGERVPGTVISAKLSEVNGEEFQVVDLKFCVGKFETVPSMLPKPAEE